jgi:hypothetical protein
MSAPLLLCSWLASMDPGEIFSVPHVRKPPYLKPVIDPTFGTEVTRISDDAGLPVPTLPRGHGRWGKDARHHYSKDQPWNSDGTLIALENMKGGSPTRLFLDGDTYKVKFGKPSGYPSGEERWHPTRAHPNERIIAKGRMLVWFDVIKNATTRTWRLPFDVIGIGDGEGNPSLDGRFILLHDATRMFLVDMDPQPPLDPYPAGRTGPAYDLSADGAAPKSWGIGWASVSPSGQYVVVAYKGNRLRVFDVNPRTLALTPRPLPKNSPRCTGTAEQGFIYDLGHADMTRNPFDRNEDVIVGQESCRNIGERTPGVRTVKGAGVGHVIMVRLRDGAVTSLTHPAKEAYPHHVSARNFDRPGWVYVGYYAYKKGAKRFNNEIVAVKLDGSGTVERLAHMHSDTPGTYRAESHAVPSRDGKRVLWASNWAFQGDGERDDIQAYAVDTRNARPATGQSPRPRPRTAGPASPPP